MLSKKKINIVLATLMVIIYSALLFKFFSPHPDVTTGTADMISSGEQRVLSRSDDSFKLVLNKRDPFLGGELRLGQSPRKSIPSPKIDIAPKRTTAIQQPLSWPVIRYFGYISSSEEEKVAVLRIREKVYRLKEGSIFEGIKLSKIQADSVKLEWERMSKYVKKEKIFVNQNN